MDKTGPRFKAALGVTTVCFVLLWLRLFDLQVVDSAYYSRIAEDNRIQLVVDLSRRGLIRDRHGTILAQNEPSYSVYLMKSKAVPQAEVVAHLARILKRDSSLIMKKLRDSRLPYFEPVRVARHVPKEIVCRIEEQNELIPGILLRYETTRRYPEPSGGSHLLGYLTEAGSQKEDTKRAPEGSFVGVRGAERQFDDYLRGADGVEYMDVTAAGQIVGPSLDQPPSPSIPGVDVQLTIDWNLQRFVTHALESRGIGSVICIDPRNGEILALVSVPGFDPNLFSGILTQEVWDGVINDSTKPLLDRSLKGLYPPASTAKLITIAAGLELGIITPTTTFSTCPGGMQFGRRYFRCWKYSGHGTLDLAGAIEQSCDVYFYQLSQRLGIERWADYARRSGFGRRTGIDLPEEAIGIVPDSNYYNRVYGVRKWTKTLVLNLGIGQGEFLATPLQVALYYCALANNGVAMRPRILGSLRTEGMDIAPTRPREAYALPYAKSTMTALRNALRRVVSAKNGTAKILNFPDLQIAGKTGTAQNPHGDNHSWFVGYAPFDKPEMVVVAIVENAGEGSKVAAPLCGEVFRFYFGLDADSVDTDIVGETAQLLPTSQKTP